MVKLILIIFLHITLSASVYEENCLACHKAMPVKIDKFFYRYLLKYSSEDNLKSAITTYLKNPTRETTILQEGLINRFGIKERTTLNDEELQEAIDKYWEIYKIFGKLK